MDASLASSAVSALGSFLQASAASNVAANQARATVAIREGNNDVAKHINARNDILTNTQRWAQKVRNSRVYEAVGNNQEALAVNYNRARDARTRQNFATNIRQAEESGRQQAAAAASGVTGSVVDVIDMTSKLRNGIQESARVSTERQISGDFKKQELSQRLATMDNLDFTAILDNPQIMQGLAVTPQYTASPWSAAFASVLNKTGAQALSNFSFSFGSADPDGSYQALEDKRLNQER